MYPARRICPRSWLGHRHGRPDHRLDGDPVHFGMVSAKRRDPAHAPRRTWHLRDRNRMASRSASLPSGCGLRASTTCIREPLSASLRGDPLTVQGYYNVCRELRNEIDLPRGIYFDQDWADTLKGDAYAPAAFTPARCINCSTCSATMSCCSSAAARSAIHGHPGRRDRQPASRWKPWCSPATRVATSGTRVGNPSAAAKWCKPVEAALDTWGKSRSTTHPLTRRFHSDGERVGLTEGNASCASPRVAFPSCQTSRIRRFVTRSNIVCAMNGRRRRFTDDPRPRNTYWNMGQSHVRPEGRKGRHDRTGGMPQRRIPIAISGSPLSRLTRGWETVRMSFIVNRPKVEPTLRMTRTDVRGRTHLFLGDRTMKSRP